MRTDWELILLAHTQWAEEEAGDASEGIGYCALLRLGSKQEQKDTLEDDGVDTSSIEDISYFDEGFYFMWMDTHGFVNYESLGMSREDAYVKWLEWSPEYEYCYEAV